MTAATNLPPFTGIQGVCPKCLHRGARVEFSPYIPVLLPGEDGPVHAGTRASGECVIRTCRCGWAWLEQCADAEPTNTTTTETP